MKTPQIVCTAILTATVAMGIMTGCSEKEVDSRMSNNEVSAQGTNAPATNAPTPTSGSDATVCRKNRTSCYNLFYCNGTAYVESSCTMYAERLESDMAVNRNSIAYDKDHTQSDIWV